MPLVAIGSRVTALSKAAWTAVHGPDEPIDEARYLVYGGGPSDIEADDIKYAAERQRAAMSRQ